MRVCLGWDVKGRLEMEKDKARLAAKVLGGLGAVFIMAHAFDILPGNIGIFLGIVTGIIVSTLWSMVGKKGRQLNEGADQ